MTDTIMTLGGKSADGKSNERICSFVCFLKIDFHADIVGIVDSSSRLVVEYGQDKR